MKMPRKLSLSFYVPVVILCFLLFSGCSAAVQAENNKTVLPSEVTDAYKNALIWPLDKAASEIKDPDLAQFWQKLTSGYELDKIGGNSGGDSNSTASLVPDLKKIMKVAMDTPLKEAGKTIHDKDIADFYNSFIESIGVDK